MKNVIKKISSNYFMWSISVLYCIAKLVPITNYTNLFTKLVFGIAIIVFCFRILNFIFINHMRLNEYIIIKILIMFSVLLSYLVESKFNFYNYKGNLMPIVIIFYNFIVLFNADNGNLERDIKYINHLINFVNYFSLIYTLISIVYSMYIGSDRSFSFSSSIALFTNYLTVAIGSATFVLLSSSNNKIKLFSMFNLILQFIALIFLQQRAGYLSVFVCMIIILLYLRKNKSITIFKKFFFVNKNYFIVLLLVVAAILVSLLLFIDLSTIVSKIINNNTSGRAELWDLAWKSFKDKNVITGIAGSMKEIAYNYAVKNNIDMNSMTYWYVANGFLHNIFYVYFVYFGIVGLILLLYFCYKVLYCLYNFIKNNANIAETCSSIFFIIAPLVLSLFDENMIINVPYFSNTMFFIICTYLCKLSLKKKQ